MDLIAFLGIDFGTSGARAIAVNQYLTLQWETSLTFPRGTGHELAMLWQDTLFELLIAIPLSLKQQLKAIAINGTSATVLLCDALGNPLDAPILYNDNRGQEVQATLQQITPINHLARSSSSSLAKLLWWSQQPYFSQARYLLHQADWLAFLLHGKLGISDYHNALKLGYDVQNLTYPSWLKTQSWFNVLPQILPPGTPITFLQKGLAQRFNLPQDCLICTGTTDSIAAFLASGASQPGEAVTSLGSTLVLKLLSQTYIEDFNSGIYSHRWGNCWLTGGASNAGGTVLKQFFSAQELITLSQQINPNQPTAYDYYPLPQKGDRFPINNPELLPRLEPRSDNPVEFLQAMLEGLSKIEALGYQKLQELGASPLTQVYTAGGGAKNLTWQQIRQRYLGVPVTVSPHTEAAYGTACLAQSGYYYKELETAFPRQHPI